MKISLLKQIYKNFKIKEISHLIFFKILKYNFSFIKLGESGNVFPIDFFYI